MDMRSYLDRGRLHSREEAAILSIFDGTNKLTAEEAAEKCSSVFGIRMDAAYAKRILEKLADDRLVGNTVNYGRDFTQRPGYKILWDGMREAGRLNPAARAIERVDSLCYPLSSDLKSFAILAMEPGKAYSRKELDDHVSGFLGGKVSLPERALVNYFWRWKDPVVPVKVLQSHSIMGEVNWITLMKEEWARHTYDPVIVAAVQVAVQLSREFGRRVTLAEIFGPSSSPGGHSKGASVYAIISTLANSKNDYTFNGLKKEIIEKFGIEARHEIKKLAEMGIIDYRSTRIRNAVDNSSGTRYIRSGLVGVEDTVEKVINDRPYLRAVKHLVRSTVEIAAASDGWIKPEDIAKRLGCGVDSVGKVLSAMAKNGLLAKWEDGSNESSIVRANRITRYMWDGIFSRIRDMAWFMHSYEPDKYGRAEESVAWASDRPASFLEGDMAEHAISMVGAYLRNKMDEMGIARKE
jgi:hypothetical protein